MSRDHDTAAPTGFIRACGTALVAGGALYAVLNGILTPMLPIDQPDEVLRTSMVYLLRLSMATVCVMLLALGCVGVHLAHRHRAGVFGAVAFIVAYAGCSLVVAVEWSNVFIMRPLAQVAPEALDPLDNAGLLNAGFGTALGLFMLGWILLAVAVLKAQVLPRWTAWTILAGLILVPVLGGALGLLGMAAGNVVFAVGLVGLGRSVAAPLDYERDTRPIEFAPEAS